MTTWRILTGDVREMLKTLPDQSVQTCVTSPPYWGLRDYGVAGQLGLESTPDAYCAAMVGVFAEVRRVLKDDGTVWLNLGDTYAAQRGGTVMPAETLAGGVSGRGDEIAKRGRGVGYQPHRNASSLGLKHKDLIGVPWMVAFALRADGWYLRSDIIWSKPNPMPESVTDRPTKAHEYIFLLSKSRSYYYNAEAIAEPASDAMFAQIDQGYNGEGRKDYEGAGVQNPSSVKARIIGNARKRADRFGGNKHDGDSTKHSDGSVYTGNITRNKRSVWHIATQPYSGAHFATFPEALIEPCILAGSREGDTVLDPFAGSGTTGAVAIRHQRHFIGCELNPAYVELARTRIGGVAPLLAREVA
jgi:DNA modification methylase